MSSRPSRGAARLAAILDALPDALLLVNCNGTVVNANTIALEAFEAPGTALVGRGLLDLLPEFDSKRIPGSMRRPDEDEGSVRTRPTRMTARRTDGSEFPVEVTSANLADGRTPYESSFEAAWADHGASGGRGSHYTGDELLMLVVRDLTGTMDTETELARQQRQTEMILRAASEGVVGVDTDGRVVLVNPAAAQILGHRASDLGGQELHPLVHHSRPDGSPLPYEETPLSDTLRSGRKHRVRAGQVLWSKNGQAVPVDMTTAPVRDGDQLVGAVLTFTDRRAYEAMAERQEQLLAVLGDALRGPLDQLRGQLTGLAADPAGQLWPEANQVLHHLAAGYARMTTLVDNVLAYQRLDAGKEKLRRKQVSLDGVVAAGVDGAVELIGPGRAQFAVHAPPIEAEVDPERMVTALAHLIADVAGVDATGTAPQAALAGGDSTIVVAAAQRGDVVRIEVRGPYKGGSPVHEPVVRGIVRQHGGVLQTHEVPGAGGGSAYVLEVPVTATPGGTLRAPSGGGGSGTAGGGGTSQGTGTGGPGGPGGLGGPGGNETTVMPVPTQPVRGSERARPGSAPSAASAEPVGAGQGPLGDPGGGPSEGTGADLTSLELRGTDGVGQGGRSGGVPAQAGPPELGQPRPTGRRRGRPSQTEEQPPPAPHDPRVAPAQHAPPPAPAPGDSGGTRRPLADREAGPDDGADDTGGGHSSGGNGTAGGRTGPHPGSGPVPGAGQNGSGNGRRARRALATPADDREDDAGPGLSGAPHAGVHTEPPGADGGDGTPQQAVPQQSLPQQSIPQQQSLPQQPQAGTGRRARRADVPGGGAVSGADWHGGPGQQAALPPAPPSPQTHDPGTGEGGTHSTQSAHSTNGISSSTAEGITGEVPDRSPAVVGGGRRARRLAAARARAEEQAAGQPSTNEPFALPPAPAEPLPGPQPLPAPAGGAAPPGALPLPLPEPAAPDQPLGGGAPEQAPEQAPESEAESSAPVDPRLADHSVVAASPILGGGPLPQLPSQQHQPPPPGSEIEPFGADRTAGGSGISVRTLGQGVPFARRFTDNGAQPGSVAASAPAPAIPSTPSTPPAPAGSGRRRRLAAPTENGEHEAAPPQAQPQPEAQQPQQTQPQAQPQPQPQPHAPTPGRQFAIGAPDEGSAEGPEPLDGPNGAVEVTSGSGSGLSMPMHPPLDDELPPEPLDNPRRLLVWPEPDVSTQQALSDRGYRPVIVHSREEVDAQIAAYPAALFVDPLTGPITRTALQSLRQAAVAAEVPVLVTAGLGQATREAAYGADPAVLLKALAPRDSEQHPPRVLLVEENPAIASAFSATLERRGMQVAHAPSDSDAVNVAAQIRPNLVVMDLMQVRRRRAGIIDWLRVNGLLHRTPFVVYTAADMNQAELPRLASGETVLFLAERSTSGEVQSRIVDLLAKIGAS